MSKLGGRSVIPRFLALALLLAFPHRLRAESEPAPQPLILLAVAGELQAPAGTLSAADQAAARAHLETVLGRQLAGQFGVRLMDETTMKKLRADTEQWAVVTGGGIQDVQALLEKLQPDYLVRATLRTSPLVQVRTGSERTGIASFWSCAAGLTVEIIPRAAAASPLALSSPPQAAPTRRLQPLETALVALDAAAAELMPLLVGRQAFHRASTAARASGTLTGKKVVFIPAGTFESPELDAAARAALGRRLVTDLSDRLAAALGLQAFDEATLATARQNAEQWAVLQGGTVEQLREALAPYALDACLRLRYHLPAPFTLKLDNGDTLFSGTAVLTLEVVDLRAARGTKAQVVETPPMGTNADPAVKALTIFDAANGALAAAEERLLERLAAVTPAAAAPAAGPPPTAGGTPTGAVLWVRADFAGWTVPRGRHPALTRKHQMQVTQFVKDAKASGALGVQVSDALTQGVAASGALLPLEESLAVREDVAGVRNKLLELRMAGWVGEKLPYDDPVAAAPNLGATYLVTARVTKIEEPQPSSVGVIGLNAAHSEVRAWAEVTVTHASTKRSWSFTGEGRLAKAGWSTGVAYTPEARLDETLFGGAVRAALFDAARRIQLPP